MKYIRYLIYLLFEAAIIGGGIALIGLLHKLGVFDPKLNAKGISTLVIFLMLPVLVAYSKDKKKAIPKLEGMKNNYLKQESEYKTIITKDWKETLKGIMNEMVVDNQVFYLDYEEEDYIAYRSEAIEQEINAKKVKKHRNRIIVELEKEEDNSIRIIAHKENQYSELSNRDNEEVIAKIVEGLKEIEKEES
jgi:hypothetical protein